MMKRSLTAQTWRFVKERKTDLAAHTSTSEGIEKTNFRIGGINHFAIEVADLDATIAALQKKGVGVVSLPREMLNSGGSRFAFIHDDERMLVELFQPA